MPNLYKIGLPFVSSRFFESAIPSATQTKDFHDSLAINLFINDDEYQGKALIPVAISVDECDGFVASDSIFNVYGVGNSVKSSLQDYEVSLKDYFKMVEDSKGMNDLDQLIFDRLNQFLSKK